MAIDILIQGEYKDRDIKRVQRDLDLLKTQSGTVGSAFSKMSAIGVGMGAAVGAAAIGAAAAGARMAVAFGVDGVKAFIADEAEAAKLAKTMSNLGMEGATAAVEANIDALQRQFGVSDSLLRPSMEKLLRSFNDVGTASQMMTLALDVSAGTGKSLEQTVQALTRAAGGNALALGRIAPELDKNILKSGDMNAITAELSRTFSGQAQTAADSYQGQLARLSVGFSELQESFGAGFLGGLGDATQGTNDFMDAMKDLEPAMRNLGTTAAKAAVGLAKFAAESAAVVDGAVAMADEPTWGELITHLRNTFEATDQFKGAIGAIPGVGRFLEDLYDIVAGFIALDDAQGNGFVDIGGGEFPNVDKAGKAWAIYVETKRDSITAARFNGKALADEDDDLSGYTASSTSAAEKTVVLTERQKSLALEMAGTQVAVKQATDDLAALTKASDDYAASITGAIKGTVDLSTAFSAAQKASQDNTLAAGESVVSTTIANFRAQILAAQQFADSLRNVAGAGGSQALIDQILQVAATQGPGAGEFLANTLVNDGVVPQLTADLAAFDVFAGDAGTAMADNFFAQGITDANALLNGLSTEVAAQQKMLDRLGRNIGLPVAAAISEEIAKAIRDGVADGRAVAARRRAEAFAAASFVPITVAPGTTGPTASFTGGGMINIPGLAVGGPASAGRPYIVGERGPELFVPGSNGNVVPNNAMGGNTYQITVQAGVGDPRAIGQQIVEYVKKFEQANGPVFRAA